MCYFLLGNSEIWLIDDDNILLFFLYFSLVEQERGTMTNNEGVSGYMIGESFNFKILLPFSKLIFLINYHCKTQFLKFYTTNMVGCTFIVTFLKQLFSSLPCPPYHSCYNAVLRGSYS